MSEHLETLDRRMALVRQGVKGEPSPDVLRTWASSVDAFPVDAWDRFLTIGGLHRLLDMAPDRVAAKPVPILPRGPDVQPRLPSGTGCSKNCSR